MARRDKVNRDADWGYEPRKVPRAEPDERPSVPAPQAGRDGEKEHLPVPITDVPVDHVQRRRTRPLSPLIAKHVDPEGLREKLFGNKTERTIRVYGDDLRRFAKFLGLSGDLDELSGHFLTGSDGLAANATVEKFMDVLLETDSKRVKKGENPTKLSAQYVNHHLAAIKALVKVGRKLGLVVWQLDVDKIAEEAPTRPTAGPKLEDVQGMIIAAAQQRDPKKQARDVAILSILASLGLRGIEVRRLDVGHVDTAGAKVTILGKGRRREEVLTLPNKTLALVKKWLDARGTEPGPLFPNLDHRPSGNSVARGKKGGRSNVSTDRRLSSNGFYAVVKAAGKRIGIKTWPHGWRHSAITTARGKYTDSRSGMAFSRHAKEETLQRYDDNVRAVGDEVARYVDETLIPDIPPPSDADQQEKDE